MIVTLTGAYRNAGDYLIGHRARALLAEHVDADIVNLDRKSIDDSYYEIFNRARAVILCGGPAYQRQIFPKIYKLDLDRINAKVVPMGLGWKAGLGVGPSDFEFAPPAENFIRRIHDSIDHSSVRDVLTHQVITNLGINNVSLTGCPAWYDLTNVEREYAFNPTTTKIVFSLPAIPQPDTFGILLGLSKMFPRATKVMAMHHGWRPAKTEKGKEMFNWHLSLLAFGVRNGWRMANIADGLTKFADLYDSADLHVGYRVHAHIYSLSQQSASILINEDTRGVGQVQTLGGPMLMADQGPQPVLDAVAAHYDSQGAEVRKSTETIRGTYPTMKAFLATI